MNLCGALNLYKILKPYLPDTYSDHLDFVKQIIHNIADGNHPEDYSKALDIISPEPLTEEAIQTFTTEEFFQFFSVTLIDIGIYDLISFCKSVGI